MLRQRPKATAEKLIRSDVVLALDRSDLREY